MSNLLFTNHPVFGSPNCLWPKNSFIFQVFNKDAECLEMVTSYYSCIWI